MSSGGIYRGPGGQELHGDGRPVYRPGEATPTPQPPPQGQTKRDAECDRWMARRYPGEPCGDIGREVDRSRKEAFCEGWDAATANAAAELERVKADAAEYIRQTDPQLEALGRKVEALEAEAAGMREALRLLYESCLGGEFYEDYDKSTDLLGKARTALAAPATGAAPAKCDGTWREAEVADLKEQLHLSNGTRGLALKHRDMAEAKVARMREALSALLPWAGVSPDGPPWATPEVKKRNREMFEAAVRNAEACFPEGWGSDAAPATGAAPASGCDMEVGPCSCGAWHGSGPFVPKKGAAPADAGEGTK